MWMYDLETLAFLEVNIAAVEKYGYTREEFLKMTLRDIRPPEIETGSLDSEAKWRLELQHATEWRHTLKSGRSIDVEISSHTLAYQGRKASFVIVQEVTERKDKQKVILDSEIRHRSLFENMQEGFAYCRMIFENDKPVDFEYLQVNDAFEKITGMKDIVGKRVTEAVPDIKESNPELFDVYGGVAKTGQPQRFDVYINPLNQWFSVSAYSFDQGFFATVFNDITGRKRLEDESRQSEDRLRRVIDTTPALIWTAQPDGSLDFVNQTHNDFTGLSLDDVRGWHWTAVIHPEDCAQFLHQWRVALATGEPLEAEARLRRIHGDYRWLLIRAVPLRDESGKIIKWYGTQTDITKRKQAEEAVRQSEARWRSLVSSSPDFIALHDREGRCLFLNRYAKGFTEKEVVGKMSFDFISPESIEIYRTAFEACVRTKTNQFAEYRAPGDSGETRTYESTFVPLLGNPDEINVMVVARDITLRKSSAEEIERSHVQLRALARHLQNVIEKERSRIAREIHDEIGQVLAATKMDLSLLSRTVGSIKEKQTQKRLSAEIKALVGLLDRGVQSLRKIVRDLQPEVLETMGLLAGLDWQVLEFGKRTGIQTSLVLASAEPVLESSYLLVIFRVVQEALTNIARHADASSANVELKEEPSSLRLTITDNGKGIGEDAKAKPGSFGLIGMRERVIAAGGTFSVHGKPGKGTVVEVVLPAQR
jgi:PAS domain S-box-containing protein